MITYDRLWETMKEKQITQSVSYTHLDVYKRQCSYYHLYDYYSPLLEQLFCWEDQGAWNCLLYTSQYSCFPQNEKLNNSLPF